MRHQQGKKKKKEKKEKKYNVMKIPIRRDAKNSMLGRKSPKNVGFAWREMRPGEKLIDRFAKWDYCQGKR
eukprot:jgi/Bigna1/147497/aug1.174_g22205